VKSTFNLLNALLTAALTVEAETLNFWAIFWFGASWASSVKTARSLIFRLASQVSCGSGLPGFLKAIDLTAILNSA